MDVPVPRKASSNEQTQWRLRKDYLERIKQSAFHLTVPPPPKGKRATKQLTKREPIDGPLLLL